MNHPGTEVKVRATRIILKKSLGVSKPYSEVFLKEGECVINCITLYTRTFNRMT